MAEKSYEFKDMATVDMVETVADTASVLIEEDGVIKRAPKNEVGGASSVGEVSDLVISINKQPYGSITADNITFTEGSMVNVVSALSEKRTPIVKLRFFIESQADYCYTASELRANVYRYGTELYFSYIYPMTYNGTVYNGYMRFTTDGVFEVHHRYSTNTTEMT